MMPDPMVTTTTADVARPLQVLLPLIQVDLTQAREAAERAALPHYQAAGEKLLEAKAQLPHGEFTHWVKVHFRLSPETARHYMRLAAHAADQTGSALPFSSLRDFARQTSSAKYPRWPVLPPGQECVAQRTLALRVIQAGYKAVAQQVHPDHGGGREEMVRLNAVREWLQECAKRHR